MHNHHTAEMIAFIKSCGYRVFIRPSTRNVENEYCFYTDGTRIGYAQWRTYRSDNVGSVHKPSRENGTGYHVSEKITRETLDYAINLVKPGWDRGRAAVVKYANWEAFHNANQFNSELIEV